MSQYDIESIAALELVEMALQSKNESCANLLIGAACRIDPSLPKEHIKSLWLESWLADNQNRSKS